VRFGFIQEKAQRYPITILCKVMNVSKSGFFAWRGRPPSKKSNEDKVLEKLVEDAHRDSRGTYGRRRIKAALAKKGVAVSRNRISRLMAKRCIRGKSPRKFRVTTIPNPKLENSPNLLKAIEVTNRLDQVWVSDITYLQTKEGWAYLCIILDLHSRKIISWAIDKHMEASLVVTALNSAIKTRNCAVDTIFHSDCGGQYKSNAVRNILARSGMKQSMTYAGNCYDNATAESFFGTLKSELDQCQFSSFQEAECVIFEYIEVFYNRKRLHSALDYKSPDEFEREAA
jgi:putative transposase